MTTIIEDGTGDGHKLKVDKFNRAFVNAITEPQADHAAETGDRYNINTGYFTLTDDLKTSVLYVKNNETENLVVTSLIYNLGTPSTSGDARLTWVRNPNSGDIIDNGNPAAINSNQNYGSAQSLDVDAYVGASAETAVGTGGVIDGDSGATISPSGSGRIFISLGALVIPKGKSIAIDYTPPSGQSSQLVNFAMSCFLQKLES